MSGFEPFRTSLSEKLIRLLLVILSSSIWLATVVAAVHELNGGRKDKYDVVFYVHGWTSSEPGKYAWIMVTFRGLHLG